MNDTQPSETGSAALRYAALGLRVFPVWAPNADGECECGDGACTQIAKHPVGSLVPRGVLDATADTATIRRWWSAYPGANIGIRTGSVSGLALIDVDPDKGGEESIHRLEAEHGALAETWRVLTGGGGWHAYLRHPGGYIGNSAGKIAPGVDVRGEGGYAVAPPSRHHSGRRYAWEIGYGPDECELADVPTWLPRTDGAKEPLPFSRLDTGAILDGVPEGQRNDQVFRLAAKLRGADVPYEMAARLIREAAANAKPPLDESEAVAALNSAYRRYAPTREATAFLEDDDAPAAEPTAARTIWTARELRALDLPPIEWVLADTIPRGRYVVLSGESGLGKSWWVLALVLHAARGMPFLGRETAPIRALYIDEENGIQEAQRRLRALCEGMGIDADEDIPVDFVIDAEIRLARPQDAAWLTRVIEERGINLIVTDSLIRFFDGDENSSRDVAAFHKMLRTIRLKTGVTWIMLQHLNKAPREGTVTPGNRLRGSGEFKANADNHVQLIGNSTDPLVRVHVEKIRGGMRAPDVIYKLEGDANKGEPVVMTVIGSTAAAYGAETAALMHACELLDERGVMTYGELRDAVMAEYQLPRTTAERGITAGRKSGAIKVDRKDGKYTFLRLGEMDDA